MKMNKIIVLLMLCVIMISGLSFQAIAADAGSEKTFELDVAITFGEPAIRHIVAMCDEVTEKTGGRVKFNIYPSNSLITIPEIPDALKDGVADVAVVPSINYPSMLAYNAEIIGMPFIGIKDNNMACELWEAMNAQFPEIQEEWDKIGAHIWFTYATAGYQLETIHQEDEIRLPEDLAGHQIMSGKQQWLNIVNKNGGAGIQTAPPQYYENLEKGVSDGVVQSYSTTRTMGITELVKAYTVFGEEGSYYDIFFIAISNKTWDSFPDDIKEVFNETNADLIGMYDENERTMIDNAEAEGMYVDATKTVLTEEEIKIWEDVFAEENQDYLDFVAKNYLKDKIFEMYDFAMDWIENYNK